MPAAAPQPAPRPSSGQSPGSQRSPHRRRSRRSSNGGGPGAWARLLIGATLALAGAGLAFTTLNPSVLQASIAAGLFSAGLASLAFELLPGRLSFKKAGVVATGGLALFLILLYWMRNAGPDTEASMAPPPVTHLAAAIIQG
jgi:hypothetical protein